MKGSMNIWALLGTQPDMDDDDKIEPFAISDLVIGLIVSTPQAPGVHILRQNDGDLEEDEEEEDTMNAGLGGDQDKVQVNIMLGNKAFHGLQLNLISYYYKVGQRIKLQYYVILGNTT